MNLVKAFNVSETGPSVSDEMDRLYGPFGFPDHIPADRPYVTSNFVTSMDGRASFRELLGQLGGKEVSRSETDAWLLNFFMAHHDASIVGAGTLRSEAGSNGVGWDLHIGPAVLEDFRHRTTGIDKQIVIVVSGSGRLDLNYLIFNSDRVEPWIATTPMGATLIQERMATRARKTKLIVLGETAILDPRELLRVLRQQHGIRTLHCLGGPTFHGELLQRALLDESFLTISTQVLGRSMEPAIERPTAFGNVSFLPQTAPWFRIVSLHYELPYHMFLRLRYEGPRSFDGDSSGT